MLSKKILSIVLISILFVTSTTNAELCAHLAKVSAGENHSLALMDDGTLWACGSNGLLQLGLGNDVSSDTGYTRSIAAEDAENL
jgi:alpha-tubulin suppressor-like RCC1 family protein